MEVAFLEALNEEQREAVTSADGPTLVLAGAGSGKTRVITYRIAYRIATGVDPATILAVTFTNKAADEMRRRVRELIRRPASQLAVHTFHALCLRLLRRFGEDIGLGRGFAVYGEDERRALLRRICQEIPLPEREFPLSRVAAAVSARKTRSFEKRGGWLDRFGSGLANVAERYQEALTRAGAVDFDDLLLRGLELFECSERTQSFAARRFQHVLVDEYQDTNRLQYRLLRLLAPHGNLFVVGDEDQSIYNFRGADLRNILDFERDFPTARVVKLEMNYRSTASILRAASAVIDHNVERKGKSLVASLGEGEKIELHEAEDERAEAEQAAEIIERLRREEEQLSVAILLRTHAQTRAFEEELVRRNLPHRVVGGLRFFERREIRDALAYVRLVLNRGDDGAFRRVVNVPSRGVGAATLALVERQATEGGSSLWEATLLLLDSDSLPGRARSGLTSFRSTIERLSEHLPRHRPAESIRRAIEESGLSPAIDEEGQGAAERRENLDQLVASAVEYEQAEPEPTLAGFLDAVSLLTDADTLDSQAPCLLMTIHAAKGLEFDVVFLAGLEEGLFPHVRASGDRRALEEERRLFYVALTRARKRLFLSYSRSRRGPYSSSSRSPSRFLGEIPSDLLSSPVPAGGRAGFAEAGSSLGAIRPGALVLHKTFGEGRVVDASGSGKDRKVTVIFRHAGRKRLLAQYAKLEVLA
jgi:DNA helicase-2/ATP-dependent DNA helicase PcrA